MSDCEHSAVEFAANGTYVGCEKCGSKRDIQAVYGELEDADAVIAELKAEVERLLIALADSIRRPMGTIPDSAMEFYERMDLEAAERRRTER